LEASLLLLVRIVFGVLGRLWCGGMARSGEVDEGLTSGLGEIFRGRKGLGEAYKSFINALVLHDGQLQVVGKDAGATTQVKDQDTLASVIPPACRSSFTQKLAGTVCVRQVEWGRSCTHCDDGIHSRKYHEVQ
jgi:hypothetical protein